MSGLCACRDICRLRISQRHPDSPVTFRKAGSLSRVETTADMDAELGARVHMLLWQQRISQTDAAHALGISQSALSRTLRGERNWRLAEVVGIAHVLGVPAAELLPNPLRFRGSPP